MPTFQLLALNNTTILWFVQSRVSSEKFYQNQTMIANDAVEQFNDAAELGLRNSPVKLWTSAAMLSELYPDESPDGIHIGPVALRYVSSLGRLK